MPNYADEKYFLFIFLVLPREKYFPRETLIDLILTNRVSLFVSHDAILTNRIVLVGKAINRYVAICFDQVFVIIGSAYFLYFTCLPNPEKLYSILKKLSKLYIIW
jgi:hypothetical protein